MAQPAAWAGRITRQKQARVALDAKGLSHCGMAHCGGEDRQLGLSLQAYRAARGINRDEGVVHRVIRLLDDLADGGVADGAAPERLSRDRAAAAGDGKPG